MSGLGFSCSYTKLKDVEGRSPCSRRATRRERGEPKCLGHWVVEELIVSIGGTEYTRRVWVGAGYLLTAVGVEYLLGFWSTWPSVLTAAFAILFCLGLFISTGWQHPFGGILCLVAVPLLAWKFLSSGVGSVRYYLEFDHPVPAHSSLALELLASSIDTEVGLIFALYTAGFYYLYRHDDHRWIRFARPCASVLGVVLLLSLAILIIGTGGHFSPMAPWAVLVFLAVLIARGPRLIKKLAMRLAAIIRV
jgi:hypothetical protein